MWLSVRVSTCTRPSAKATLDRLSEQLLGHNGTDCARGRSHQLTRTRGSRNPEQDRRQHVTRTTKPSNNRRARGLGAALGGAHSHVFTYTRSTRTPRTQNATRWPPQSPSTMGRQALHSGRSRHTAAAQRAPPPARAPCPTCSPTGIAKHRNRACRASHGTDDRSQGKRQDPLRC